MKKGFQHRIGTSSLLAKNHTGGLGLGGRVRVEDAERAWILQVCDSELEARTCETHFSLMFGIPETLFPTDKRIRTKEVDIEYLENLWKKIGNNTQQAFNCLVHFGLDYKLPLYTRCNGRGAQHFGKYTSIVYACNVLSDVMSMRTFDGYEHRGAGNWYPVSVSQSLYAGDVCSLEVENSESESPGRHLYVSDGVVTHNSIYAFRGSFMDSMDRMKDTTGAHELPLSVTYRSRQAIVDFVNDTIPGSAMIAHKEGGSVATTFKKDLVQTVVGNNVSMIVGARNKSLVECWITLAKAKVSSTLKGSSIVKEIRDVIKEIKPETLEQLCAALRTIIDDAVVVNADGEATYKIPESQVELILVVPELVEIYDIHSLTGLEEILKDMEKEDVRELHTVHSAKG